MEHLDPSVSVMVEVHHRGRDNRSTSHPRWMRVLSANAGWTSAHSAFSCHHPRVMRACMYVRACMCVHVRACPAGNCSVVPVPVQGHRLSFSLSESSVENGGDAGAQAGPACRWCTCATAPLTPTPQQREHKLASRTNEPEPELEPESNSNSPSKPSLNPQAAL